MRGRRNKGNRRKRNERRMDAQLRASFPKLARRARTALDHSRNVTEERHGEPQTRLLPQTTGQRLAASLLLDCAPDHENA